MLVVGDHLGRGHPRTEPRLASSISGRAGSRSRLGASPPSLPTHHTLTHLTHICAHAIELIRLLHSTPQETLVKLASKALLTSGATMLAAARQTALHSAGPELLLEESTTAATAASPLRAAGAEIATGGATSGSAMAGLGSSVRLAVAESMSTFGRAEAAGGSLASQSLLVAEESLTTLRGDVSNAFQSGLEDVLDTNPINVSSVTDQAKTLLPSFQTAAA